MIATEDAVMMIAAVEKNPYDTTAYGACLDALQEAGKSLLAAKRLANAAKRTGVAAVRLADATAKVAAKTAAGARLRTACRPDGVPSSVEVVVIPGDQQPRCTGDAPYHTFRKGGVCQFPGAARRKGYKTDYHVDTRVVTVGCDWILARP